MVYEPPAFASLRVPLLLTQKGEGGSQTRPYRLGSRLRGNDVWERGYDVLGCGRTMVQVQSA